MKHWTEFESDFKNTNREYFKKRGNDTLFSDEVLTFDIETSSMYYIDGAWHSFDYSKEPDFYSGRAKAGTCYIWMFGFRDNVYYGRYILEFKEVLEILHRIDAVNYIIYIHNLSFEFYWLLDVIGNYKIVEMVARSPLKPITFKIEELNIYFRCSYMLTNLSLENAGKKFTEIRKASGDLDYIPLRGSATYLTQEELYYCEMDIRVLSGVIWHYKKLYGSIAQIPLTATGEVRKELNKRVDYNYHREMWSRIPDATTYLMLMKAFWGGITHPNILNALIKWKVGDNCDELHHKDETSAYPCMMLLYKYPRGKFFQIDPEDADTYKGDYALLYHVKLKGLRSRYYNHYIPISKIMEYDGRLVADNGRLVKCSGTVEMMLTDIDLEIIEDAYDMDEEWIITCLASRLEYLDSRVLDFILTLYEDKTKLKGIESQKVFYDRQKALLNSLFGCSCTNALKAGVEYNQSDESWTRPDLTEDYVREKVKEMKDSFSLLFFYGVGVWVTAYNRRALWRCIIGKPLPDDHPDFFYDESMDADVIYYDTDSIFHKGDHDRVFDSYNKWLIEAMHNAADECGMDFERYHPKDIKGIEHMLGVYDSEDNDITELKALGAKKYCTREGKDQSLHMTVAGVRKGAVTALQDDLDNFRNDMQFSYNISKKLTHFYQNDQEPIRFIDLHGEVQTADNRHAIILQPTTYKLGVTEYYEALHNIYEFGEVLEW